MESKYYLLKKYVMWASQHNINIIVNDDNVFEFSNKLDESAFLLKFGPINQDDDSYDKCSEILQDEIDKSIIDKITKMKKNIV